MCGRWWKCLVPDGVHFFQAQVVEKIERAKTAVSVERSLGRVLCELLTKDWRASFVNCVRERMSVGGVPVIDVTCERCCEVRIREWKVLLQLR